MVAQFLLQPIHPASYLAFNVQFGQILDLPLDDNNLIESIEEQPPFKAYEFSPGASPRQDPSSPDHEQSDTQRTRWDIEPDWRSSPQNIRFQCRLNGVPQCSFSPRWLQPQLVEIHRVSCCDMPTCRQKPHTTVQSTYIKPDLDQDEIWTAVPYTRARRSGYYNVRVTANEGFVPL